ncbi:MAG: DUF2271 domain-containing protein, partial [Gracilibacteraceae bacterium]|nr:DUF2271 domain-containing protein [Gracilibacteraceae bacterium]
MRIKRSPKPAVLIAALILLTALCACAGGGPNESPAPGAAPPAQNEAPPPPSDAPAPAPESAALSGIALSFDFERQAGYASNQFAVWIEDAGGNLVKTLYATGFTAEGGYIKRPESIPTWVEKSGLARLAQAEVDAVTGATPNSGALSYTWDLTDAGGDAVPAGEYVFVIEGSLRWQNRVRYTGGITVGGEPSVSEAVAE